MAAAGDLDDDFMKELEELVSCSICMSFMDQPKTLSCGHSFCAGCLSDWHQSQNTGNYGSGQNVIQCPECRAMCNLPAGGISALSTNYRINQILTVIQTQQTRQPTSPPPPEVNSSAPSRLCNESLYGTWRQTFSIFCKQKLEEAMEPLQAKLSDIENKEYLLCCSSQAFDDAAEKVKEDINERMHDLIHAAEESKRVLTSDLEKGKLDYDQRYKVQSDHLRLSHQSFSSHLQLIVDAINDHPRSMMKFYQENLQLIEQVTQQAAASFNMPAELNSMMVFERGAGDYRVQGDFGKLKERRLGEESPPATNPYLRNPTLGISLPGMSPHMPQAGGGVPPVPPRGPPMPNAPAMPRSPHRSHASPMSHLFAAQTPGLSSSTPNLNDLNVSPLPSPNQNMSHIPGRLRASEPNMISAKPPLPPRRKKKKDADCSIL